MFIILNRLRGTNGVWSKFNGLLLSYILLSVFNNHYVALGVGLLYVIGENLGWGLSVGNLTVHRNNTILDDGEGKNNGIQWLTRKLVPNYQSNMMTYCRVFLVIRGFYWWIPTLAPLYFVGFNPLVILGCILFLSFGFPISCEIGYRTSKLFSFKKYGFSMSGGWEHQEVWYGLMQDFVILSLIFLI